MKTLLPILLGSTALIASPALADAGQVPAETASPVVTISKADFDRIMSRLDSVESELSTLKGAQAATAAQVAAKPAAPAPATIPAWIGNTSISGKGYANVSAIDHKRDGVSQPDTGTATELKRFYVGIDHKFNDMFSANVTTDFRYGNSNDVSNGKDVLVYIKKAYLQAKFAPELWVRVGAADLPWVPFDEGIYGYRFVENTLIDRTKFGTSSDWGVHVGGTFAGGLVNYQVSAIDGNGYKTLTHNTNTIDLEGRVDVHPIKPITLAGGFYTGKLGKSFDTGPDTRRTTRWNALAAYTDSRVRAGVEYFHAKNFMTVTGPFTDSSDGWSAFGSFAFNPQFAVFGRYDWVKPSKNLNPELRDHYFNVGVDYKPIKQLDLALVYKRDKATHGLISTSNGTIGGVDHGTYDEFGLFTQFAF
jgi:hypothetical protein